MRGKSDTPHFEVVKGSQGNLKMVPTEEPSALEGMIRETMAQLVCEAISKPQDDYVRSYDEVQAVVEGVLDELGISLVLPSDGRTAIKPKVLSVWEMPGLKSGFTFRVGTKEELESRIRAAESHLSKIENATQPSEGPEDAGILVAKVLGVLEEYHESLKSQHEECSRFGEDAVYSLSGPRKEVIYTFFHEIGHKLEARGLSKGEAEAAADAFALRCTETLIASDRTLGLKVLGVAVSYLNRWSNASEEDEDEEHAIGARYLLGCLYEGETPFEVFNRLRYSEEP